jgi:hypothetical protein
MSYVLQKYFQSSISLADGSCVRKPPSFSTNQSPKKYGNYTLGVWRAVWCLTKGSEDGLDSTLAEFSSNKSGKKIGRKHSYASRLPKKEEIKEIFVLISKES